MGQVLYRKYRSKSLDELKGQSHVTTVLKKAIATNKVAHAYLLTGPRGTGKTSIARIIAHSINQFEYDEPCAHIDIIEIDAASNRRIDEIRDLREKVVIAPSLGRYKVYIIDEVHMLTREAFNALLKTLEEPPEHAVFILATTELHKVPETIVSRTQRFSLKPINTTTLIARLAEIATAEKLDFTPEALTLIAEHADGGFRDAISLLDQVRHSSETITEGAVLDTLGAPPKQHIDELWQHITEKSSKATTTLQDLYDNGYHAPQIAKQLLSRALHDHTVSLAKKLLTVESSHDAKTELYLFILENMESDTPKPLEQPVSVAQPTAPESHLSYVSESHTVPDNTGSADSIWEQILEHIRTSGHSVYGPLRLAEADIKDSVVTLSLKFPFHIKRINERENITIIQDAIERITGVRKDVIVQRKQHDEQKVMTTMIVPTENDNQTMSDPLSLVKSVFGSAEIL